MKKYFLLTVLLFLIPSISAADILKIENTNLDGIEIHEVDEIPYIKYKDEKFQLIRDINLPYVFFNGSLVIDSDIISYYDINYISLKNIEELMQIDVDLNLQSKIVKIKYKNKSIEYKISSVKNDSEIKNKALVKNGKIYLPIRNFFEMFSFSVDYYSTKTDCFYPIIKNKDQIFIYNYEGKNEISKEDAILILKGEILRAAEKKYEDDNDSESKRRWEDYVKFKLNTGKISGETDRFYIIPVVFDFFVDKYTGEIIVYYNGEADTYYKFVPDKYSLAFSG